MAEATLAAVTGLAIILAMAVGANNSAAAMGTAYGAGIRTRRQSLLIVFVFFFLGAVLGGAKVTGSIAGGYVDVRLLTGQTAPVMAVTALSALFILTTNYLRAPISTALSTIFCIVGVGLYTSGLNVPFFLTNAVWWVLTPAAAILGGFVWARWVHPWALERVADFGAEEKVNRILALSLTFTGSYIAFSIGANSLGKAMGPAVGFGLDAPTAILLGAIAMSVGAVLMGARVIHTVGKDIAEICPIRAGGVEMVSGTIIILAAFLGIPISVTQTHTSSVIGLSMGKKGVRGTVKIKVVKRTLMAWFAVPVAAVVLTYGILWLLGWKPPA
ncbi:MAG: inorganic phosphate transporter [Halobacteria archaeon]